MKEQFSLLQLTCLLLLATWLYCSEDLVQQENEIPSPASTLLPAFAAGWPQELCDTEGLYLGEV